VPEVITATGNDGGAGAETAAGFGEQLYNNMVTNNKRVVFMRMY
jgi:hypothetical protein